MTEKITIEMTVNGKYIHRQVKADTTLLDFLRDDLNLTGVKNGCGTGHCGACTVILNGQRPARLHGQASPRQSQHGRDHRSTV